MEPYSEYGGSNDCAGTGEPFSAQALPCISADCDGAGWEEAITTTRRMLEESKRQIEHLRKQSHQTKGRGFVNGASVEQAKPAPLSADPGAGQPPAAAEPCAGAWDALGASAANGAQRAEASMPARRRPASGLGAGASAGAGAGVASGAGAGFPRKPPGRQATPLDGSRGSVPSPPRSRRKAPAPGSGRSSAGKATPSAAPAPAPARAKSTSREPKRRTLLGSAKLAAPSETRRAGGSGTGSPCAGSEKGCPVDARLGGGDSLRERCGSRVLAVDQQRDQPLEGSFNGGCAGADGTGSPGVYGGSELGCNGPCLGGGGGSMSNVSSGSGGLGYSLGDIIHQPASRLPGASSARTRRPQAASHPSAENEGEASGVFDESSIGADSGPKFGSGAFVSPELLEKFQEMLQERTQHYRRFEEAQARMAKLEKQNMELTLENHKLRSKGIVYAPAMSTSAATPAASSRQTPEPVDALQFAYGAWYAGGQISRSATPCPAASPASAMSQAASPIATTPVSAAAASGLSRSCAAAAPALGRWHACLGVPAQGSLQVPVVTRARSESPGPRIHWAASIGSSAGAQGPARSPPRSPRLEPVAARVVLPLRQVTPSTSASLVLPAPAQSSPPAPPAASAALAATGPSGATPARPGAGAAHPLPAGLGDAAAVPGVGIAVGAAPSLPASAPVAATPRSIHPAMVAARAGGTGPASWPAAPLGEVPRPSAVPAVALSGAQALAMLGRGSLTARLPGPATLQAVLPYAQACAQQLNQQTLSMSGATVPAGIASGGGQSHITPPQPLA
eukprot:TRINITY_DN22466_c1_g5_i1.p1 TRINITY_DN22466_c1_g5~~TRINITY_DN22466_c1_g5_i1.p1  ORF type:complete len:794 (+),score=153.54 TRINITY_DN22466_c1_g5_i1:104-2485(+)